MVFFMHRENSKNKRPAGTTEGDYAQPDVIVCRLQQGAEYHRVTVTFHQS